MWAFLKSYYMTRCTLLVGNADIRVWRRKRSGSGFNQRNVHQIKLVFCHLHSTSCQFYAVHPDHRAPFLPIREWNWSTSFSFLDAPSHLYKWCVRPSVRRSVTPSLRRLLGASDAKYSALFNFKGARVEEYVTRFCQILLNFFSR